MIWLRKQKTIYRLIFESVEFKITKGGLINDLTSKANKIIYRLMFESVKYK